MAEKFANEAPLYEEFEPFCKWQRKQDEDVLEIHLQDFKKEHLKVQISNHGILKISGERPLDASKHTKFYKEVPVPSTNYNTAAIHAKFVSSNLIITLPKVKLSTIDTKVSSSEPPKVDQTPRPKSTTRSPHIGGVSSGPKEQAPTPKESGLTKFELEKRKQAARRMARVAASLAATAAAVAVLIAYVVYMLKSTVPEFGFD